MEPKIETKVAEQHAGGTVALAKLFRITHNSVSQWGDHLPEARAYELRVKKPDWFFRSGKIKPAPQRKRAA